MERGLTSIAFRCTQTYRPRPNTRMQSDRFAREIVAFLALFSAARARRLMRERSAGSSTLVANSIKVIWAMLLLPPP